MGKKQSEGERKFNVFKRSAKSSKAVRERSSKQVVKGESENLFGFLVVSCNLAYKTFILSSYFTILFTIFKEVLSNSGLKNFILLGRNFLDSASGCMIF